MRRVLVRALVVVWVVAALAATWTRAHLWTSEAALWADAARHAPWKPRPWVNLGRAYAINHDNDLAAHAYAEAMQLSMRPGRSKDEQIFGRGIAAANLAILRCQAYGDIEGAWAIVRPLMSRANYPDPSQPIAVALREVNLWLDQRAHTGGCVPVSSY